MGARQSKRSVDITSAKEVTVEASEVADGSGGEGKVERIEDIDTLKPQLNGDAHQEEQISEKEKKMQEQDERQENEKDNCNEKEIVLTPVTVNGSGEGEGKEEDKNEKNAEQEVKEKKPKKEKVKKKWSLRSISFSNKDKKKPAKKEETNGECEKVAEEGAEAAPVVAEVAEKVENAPEKDVSEKEPETPVTEPLTNGSSAPETPKEEEKQSEELVAQEPVSLVEPVVEEKKEEAPIPEAAPEAPKPAEKVEVLELPVNGLSIEEPAQEEVKTPVQEDKVPEVVAEKCEIIGDSEVCVEKESPEVGSVEVAPPPLPSCPPPSSITIFAESTMAPLDTQNVDASVPTLLPAVLAQSEPESTEKNTPSESVVPIQEHSAAPVTVEKPSDSVPTPVGIENLDVAKDVSPVVEMVAVVSSDDIVTSDPDFSIVAKSAPSDPDVNSPTEVASQDVTVVPDNSVQTESEVTPIHVEDAPTDNSSNLEPPKEVHTDSIGETPIPKVDDVALPVENVNISDEFNLPSPVEETNTSHESPILQRASSDLDVSETLPPSDSFPPPPPLESCPESITESSASESLPPPVSEFSVPDAILNSPTSEVAELPEKKDILSNVDNVPETKEVQENGVHHPEVNGFSVEDNSPSEVTQVADHQAEPAFEIPQVKSVSDVSEVPAVTESAPSEISTSGDTAAAE